MNGIYLNNWTIYLFIYIELNEIDDDERKICSYIVNNNTHTIII